MFTAFKHHMATRENANPSVILISGGVYFSPFLNASF